MEKMKPEIKAKWLTALRSGDYQQGKGYLRRQVDGSDQYCCLGVLCDLYSKEFGVEWQGGLDVITFLGNSSYLPEEVQDWSGVNGSGSAESMLDYECNSLSWVNDQNNDFNQVIELIEECL